MFLFDHAVSVSQTEIGRSRNAFFELDIASETQIDDRLAEIINETKTAYFRIGGGGGSDVIVVLTIIAAANILVIVIVDDVATGIMFTTIRQQQQ